MPAQSRQPKVMVGVDDLLTLISAGEWVSHAMEHGYIKATPERKAKADNFKAQVDMAIRHVNQVLGLEPVEEPTEASMEQQVANRPGELPDHGG